MKDLGAGGVLCATVELVAEQGFGAKISVDAIHVAEKSLPAAVILCAETQERFCFAVPPDLTPLFLEHFNTRWDFPNVSEGARFGDWESSSKRNLSCDLSTRGSMSCKNTRYYERNFS